jgi:alpha-ribazole phosphatase/probable phosphoglycerate mutase
VSDSVRLWCLRHAESDNVVNGVAGAVPLAQLTPAGRAQAVAAGVTLAAEPIAKVYTSTALRARQTGQLLGGTEVRTMPGLVEVGIGAAEGSTDPAIRQRTADVLHTWVVLGDLDEQVADGETGHDVLARMTTAFDTLAATHAGETVAVVGHVASLTVVLALLCGLGARVWGAPLRYAEPFLITGHSGSWQCPTWPID